MWVTDVGSQTVSDVDLADDDSVRVYGSPSPPTALAYTPGQLWVTYEFSSDPERRVDVLKSGAGGLAPSDVTVPAGTSSTAASNRVVWFLASRAAAVVRYDTTTSRTTRVGLPADSGR